MCTQKLTGRQFGLLHDIGIKRTPKIKQNQLSSPVNEGSLMGMAPVVERIQIFDSKCLVRESETFIRNQCTL